MSRGVGRSAKVWSSSASTTALSTLTELRVLPPYLERGVEDVARGEAEVGLALELEQVAEGLGVARVALLPGRDQEHPVLLVLHEEVAREGARERAHGRGLRLVWLRGRPGF